MSKSKAQDPNEAFDVVTADGEPTGVVKSRSAVHREGGWHRSIHVWIAGTNESGPYLIFQRRSPAKDTWGGKFDATVGGHFRAGETLTETMREVEEEIGIRVAETDLLPLGVRVCVTESAEARDHELQSVFLWLTDRPLLTFAPNPDELASLNQFRIADLFALFEGAVDRIDSLAKRPGLDSIDVETVALGDFIPNIDRYFYRVAIAADRALNGERRLAI